MITNFNFFLKLFANFKNYFFGIMVNIILISLLYSFVPIGYLSYGIFNFCQVFLLISILFVNKEILEYFRKRSTSDIIFYSMLLFSMILFMIPIGIFTIFNLIIYQILFNSASLISTIFTNMPTIIEWSFVNWYSVAYIFFLNIFIVFTLYLIFKDFSKKTLLPIITIFVILYLFVGGFFIGYFINKDNLSVYDTKIIGVSNDLLFLQIIRWLNPFYWINMMSSTLFLTDGIFLNYNIFSLSINDLYSIFSVFAPPFMAIFLFSLFIVKERFKSIKH